MGSNTIDCLFVGDADTLLAQRGELEAAGATISANPDDQDTCWYSVGNEYIKPVEFTNPYLKMEGATYPEGQLLFFNKGTPAEIPDKFKAEEFVHAEVVEFLAIEVSDADSPGKPDDILNIETTLIPKIKKDWPEAVIMGYDIRLTNTVEGKWKYAIYIVGKHLPQPESRTTTTKRPEIDTAHCPEWVTHTQAVKGDITLEGWEVIKSPSPLGGEGRGEGVYLAIPRKELKEEIGKKLSRTELYEYHLRSRLGFSEYFQGDNPIRLLKDVKPVEDGIPRLECPVFNFEVVEVPKNEDNCLAWVEARHQRLSPSGHVQEFNGGYLIDRGEGKYEYISAKKRLDIYGAQSQVFKQTPDKDGFDKTVSFKETIKDRICPAYEISVNYTERPPEEITNNNPRDDSLKLRQMFHGNPRVMEKLEALGKLGPVILARPMADGPKRAQSLIEILKAEFHSDIPVERLETCLAVDQSESMVDDTKEVSNNLDQLLAEAAASAEGADLCLIRFTADDERNDLETVLHFQEGRELDETARAGRNGLMEIAANPHGGYEYIHEAAYQGLDEFDQNGTKGADIKRKILILTDEGEQIKLGGHTPEEVIARAALLGVEFRTIFIAEDERKSSPLKAYLDYLDINGIDISKMDEEERIRLWKKVLYNNFESDEVNQEVARRLSKVSKRNREKAAEALVEVYNKLSRTSALDSMPVMEALANLGGAEAEEALSKIDLDTNDIFYETHQLHTIEALRKIGTKTAIAKAKKMAKELLFDHPWVEGANPPIYRIANLLDEGDIERLKEDNIDDKMFGSIIPKGWFEGGGISREKIIGAIAEHNSKQSFMVLKGLLGEARQRFITEKKKEAWFNLEDEIVLIAFSILKMGYDDEAFSAIIEHSELVTYFDDRLLRAIAKYGEQRRDADLEKFLENDAHGDASFLSALLLAKRGHKKATSVLEDTIKMEGIRLARIINKYFIDPSAVKWLDRLLDDKDVDAVTNSAGDSIASLAIQALINIDDLRAREILASPSLSNHPYVRFYKTKELAKTDSSEAVKQLILFCQDMDPILREMAAETLGDIGGKAEIPILSELLSDPDADVIEAAGRAIEELQKR